MMQLGGVGSLAINWIVADITGLKDEFSSELSI